MHIQSETPHWHALPADQVCARLGCAPERGLDEAEAARRLSLHGPNQLVAPPARAAWRRFLDQFRSTLVLVLLAAAIVAVLLGDVEDALVIALVVVVNATLGFTQEHRAEAALAALRKMLAPSCRVRRGGRIVETAAASLVPGDILLLEAGDRVAADARVLQAHGAELAEAALTGEAMPVIKTPRPAAPEAALADQGSLVFMNTVVTRGRLEAVVVQTGMATETGRLAGLLAREEEAPTPLQTQLDALGKRLALIAGAVVAVMFLVGLVRGDDLARTAMTAIALAVAAVPEGLPAVVTVTLALGMQRMARRHAVVKRLAAVETLGCTTVICTDKTGTLTLNQMTARALYCHLRRFPVSGEGYGPTGSIGTSGQPMPDLRPALLPAALCADARLSPDGLIGDPTEGALLALAAKAGLESQPLVTQMPRLAEIPFDPDLKLMATFHRAGDAVQMWLKGAPDVVLARAAFYLDDSGAQPLTESVRAAFAAENAALAGQAMRVLALAGRSIPAGDFDAAVPLERWTHELTLHALVGIIDPPRPEAREALRTCQEAGITVKMITGDHPLTAGAIARELGLAGAVREGRALDGLDDRATAALAEETGVFARVTPEHKLRIVRALQARGHVVAMTGDGVNDAPALKAADIGIAMGITGTEVTREAATMVLTDDNFSSIVRAVKEGRTLYENIVRFVRFQLSTNIGALLTVLGALLCGFSTPFTAIQILWVNIIMDGPPAMTLGVEPSRHGLMNEPPRARGASILSWQRLGRISLYGLTMAAGTLWIYHWGLQQGGEPKALTLAFTTFVLFQFFNIFNARAEHSTSFNRQFFRNAPLWLALAVVLVLQGVAVHWPPAQRLFDTVPLTLEEWGWAALTASSVLVLDEARKLLRHLTAREEGPAH